MEIQDSKHARKYFHLCASSTKVIITVRLDKTDQNIVLRTDIIGIMTKGNQMSA